MKLRFFFVILAVALAASAGTIVYTPVPMIGPNPYGPADSSYSAYAAGVIAGLEGYTSGGQVGRNSVTTPSRNDILVTDYPSWLGVTPPPAGHENDWGTSLFVGVHVVDVDNPFRLSDLSVYQSSGDPWNYFSYSEGYAGTVYTAGRVGIWYGPDGIKGTADDIRYQNGEDAGTLINELMYVGLSAGYPATSYYGYSSDQAGLNQAAADFGSLGQYVITTCYSVNGACDVPEPATIGFAATAFLALFLLRRLNARFGP